MEDERNAAYRFLLYWATLDTRLLAWPPSRREWWNPLFWRRYIRRVRCMGELAEWLHNLAAFSMEEFTGFDEARFWHWHDGLIQKFPELTHYRQRFESELERRRGKRIVGSG